MDEGAAGAGSEESGVLDSEDILAAYRARREARSLDEAESKHERDGASARASEDGVASGVDVGVGSEEGAGDGSGPGSDDGSDDEPEAGGDAGAGDAPTSPRGAADSEDDGERKPEDAPRAAAVEDPVATAADAPPDAPAEASAPTSTHEPTATHEPAPVPATTASPPALAVPRGSPLTALQPGMGLADRLLADTTVTVRGNLLARTVAAVAAVLGLFVLVLERRGARLTGTEYVVSGTEVPVAAVAWVLTLLGVAAFVAFLFYPAARTLDVRLAASQQEEWKRVQDEAKMLHVLQLLGLGLLAGGLLLALLAYAVFPDRQLVAGSGLGIVLAVAGAVLAGVAASRRSAVHRLYVQTLVLSRLEQTGLGVPGAGGPDERVAPVLKALDQLLGHLPESAVRSFLQSEHAQAYLELIDEAKDGD